MNIYDIALSSFLVAKVTTFVFTQLAFIAIVQSSLMTDLTMDESTHVGAYVINIFFAYGSVSFSNMRELQQKIK
jgi:hypothetical protein